MPKPGDKRQVKAGDKPQKETAMFEGRIGTGLGLCFGLLLYIVIATLLLYLVAKPPKLHHRVQFKRIFGHWPAKNDHLRAYQEKLVFNELARRARTLKNANTNKDDLLQRVKRTEVSYAEAERRIPKAEQDCKRLLGEFQRAHRLAVLFRYFTREHEKPFEHYLQDRKP